jgi:hypothetical protein
MPRATRIWLLVQGLLPQTAQAPTPHPCRDSRHSMIIASDVACPIADRLAGVTWRVLTSAAGWVIAGG